MKDYLSRGMKNVTPTATAIHATVVSYYKD